MPELKSLKWLDLFLFVLRSFVVVLFLVSVIVHAIWPQVKSFWYLAVVLTAMGSFDLFAGERRVTDRNLAAGIVYYLMMIGLAALSAAAL